MHRCRMVLTLVLFAAACSRAGPPEPPTPPQLDPTGVYDVVVNIEGMGQIPATFTITGAPGAYEGVVDSEMGPSPVTNITIDGNTMTFFVDTPQVSVFFNVLFEGDGFTGSFDAGGGAVGYVSGKRRMG
jgi:hypothetical protein